MARILKLTKKSAERRKAWDGLVKQGDFNHKYTVLEKGKGVVIPKYRNVEIQDTFLANTVKVSTVKMTY